jgi:hypothetical protein
MGLRDWFRRRREGRKARALFESKIVVTFDDDGISARYPNGNIEQISWREVEKARIETNDSGSWGTDFWWIFEGAGRRCAYPQGATGELEVFRVLGKRLPGFNFEAVIEANVSTSNAEFVCWERRPLTWTAGMYDGST